MFDADAGRGEWERRLSRPVVARRVGQRTVAVRDLQVNEDGDVFLMYSAGNVPGEMSDARAELSDEFGTQYVRGGQAYTFASP